MRPLFHLSASHLTLLSLSLLCPIPWTVTSHPLSPAALPPSVDAPGLESTLLHLQAALVELRDDGLVRPEAWGGWTPRPWRALAEPVQEAAAEAGSWEQETAALPRAQRGDLTVRPLSPFPGGHSLESLHYQDRGDVEDGGKRNEALTSIAGGLQAVSREKGGFGFRFGRKRWTDRGWKDKGRGSTEEHKWN